MCYCKQKWESEQQENISHNPTSEYFNYIHNPQSGPLGPKIELNQVSTALGLEAVEEMEEQEELDDKEFIFGNPDGYSSDPAQFQELYL